jgi:hypothetical protein
MNYLRILLITVFSGTCGLFFHELFHYALHYKNFSRLVFFEWPAIATVYVTDKPNHLVEELIAYSITVVVAFAVAILLDRATRFPVV